MDGINVVSKKEWFKIFDEILDRNAHCGDEWKMLCANPKISFEMQEYAIDQAEMYDRIYENNEYLRMKATLEDEYVLYALDEARTPTLYSCTEREYYKHYHKDGRVKLPDYIR